MAVDNDRASSTGTVVGILMAVALVALIFGAYSFLNGNGPAQTTATSVQQTAPTPPANTTPAPENNTTPSTPQASPDSNPPKDGESSSQNAK